jgi:hypothetical protein
MAAMQRQMASMSPDMLKQQMDLMGSMSPEMIKQQMDMMKQMPPDQLEHMKQEAEKLGPAGVAQRVKQMQDYQLNGSNQLKANGNSLIKQQKYEEALEKYTRAITNLEGVTQSSGPFPFMLSLIDVGGVELAIKNRFKKFLCFCKPRFQLCFEL